MQEAHNPIIKKKNFGRYHNMGSTSDDNFGRNRKPHIQQEKKHKQATQLKEQEMEEKKLIAATKLQKVATFTGKNKPKSVRLNKKKVGKISLKITAIIYIKI